MKKIIQSFKNINHKLFISLLVMGLVPTIYTTLRVFWLGNLPGDWSYSIAGQLSWINLIYEVINEAIILPLFYFVGKVLSDKKELTNRMKTGLLITLGIYILLSIFIMSCTNPLLKAMATDSSIIDASATYIRIEAIANVFGILSQFALVGLVTLGKDKFVYILTGVKLVLCVVLDLFLVSSLACSFNLGVNGIGISNIIVNFIIFGTTLFLLAKNEVNVFNKEKLDFKWMKEAGKICTISGLESFVRNLAYMVMIARMVNVVNEQGIYWVANNFIWGWMLLPVIQLGELIKQETSTNKDAVKNNTLGYITITTITIIAWCILIPLYKPFMQYVLNYSDIDKLFELVMVLFGFYILYAIQNICDSTFYGLGKTHYMLFESIVTNSIYYGIAFILYITGVWHPTLIGIALLFGIGNAFDTFVSIGVYYFSLRKNKINIGVIDIIKSIIKSLQKLLTILKNKFINGIKMHKQIVISVACFIVFFMSFTIIFSIWWNCIKSGLNDNQTSDFTTSTYVAVLTGACAIIGGICTLVGVWMTIKTDEKRDKIKKIEARKPEIIVPFNYNISELVRIRLNKEGKEERAAILNKRIVLKSSSKSCFVITDVLINDKTSFFPNKPIYVEPEKTIGLAFYLSEELLSVKLHTKAFDGTNYNYNIVIKNEKAIEVEDDSDADNRN